MQFLDVSVKVGVAGGWRAEGERRRNWERGMLFRNPFHSFYQFIMWTAKWFPRKGYLIKYLKFSEVQSERKWIKRQRIRDRRRKRNRGPGGREKGRWSSWCGQIERGQCKLLSAVRNLRMQSWSVENFSLIVFWFISGKSTWIEWDKGQQDGKKTSFYFFIFFCK